MEKVVVLLAGPQDDEMLAGQVGQLKATIERCLGLIVDIGPALGDEPAGGPAGLG